MRHQRKPAKVRVGKTSVPVPDIPLQEPILITDLGKMERPVLLRLECSFLQYLDVCAFWCRQLSGLSIVLMNSAISVALLVDCVFHNQD
jgi:hypothetical protein